MDLRRLPGGDLIAQGLDDLAHERETAESLLVQVGAPRLARLGLRIPSPPPYVEHRLYAWLAARDPVTAHSRYNALIRRLVSFERAAECAG
jgi:hypothetical protein